MTAQTRGSGSRTSRTRLSCSAVPPIKSGITSGNSRGARKAVQVLIGKIRRPPPAGGFTATLVRQAQPLTASYWRSVRWGRACCRIRAAPGRATALPSLERSLAGSQDTPGGHPAVSEMLPAGTTPKPSGRTRARRGAYQRRHGRVQQRTKRVPHGLDLTGMHVREAFSSPQSAYTPRGGRTGFPPPSSNSRQHLSTSAAILSCTCCRYRLSATQTQP